MSLNRSHARVLLPLIVIAVCLLGGEAVACPGCKDGVAATDQASINMARGYFYSILLMLAMPFTLAGCFGLYVWREVRRQRRAGESAAGEYAGATGGRSTVGIREEMPTA